MLEGNPPLKQGAATEELEELELSVFFKANDYSIKLSNWLFSSQKRIRLLHFESQEGLVLAQCLILESCWRCMHEPEPLKYKLQKKRWS